MKKSALVLLSGGLDSTTCLYWAKREFEVLHAISFRYGQRHVKELEYAERNAHDAGVITYRIIDIPNTTGASPLLTKTAGARPVDPKLHATFTPGRNAVFLSVAAGKAYDLECSDIVTGVCATDETGFPDCRPEFVAAITKALSLATGKPLTIHAPLLHLTKAETWKLGAELGITKRLIEHTLSDYNGCEVINEWGRGKLDNDASRLRAKGFEEAKEKGWV